MFLMNSLGYGKILFEDTFHYLKHNQNQTNNSGTYIMGAWIFTKFLVFMYLMSIGVICLVLEKWNL